MSSDRSLLHCSDGENEGNAKGRPEERDATLPRELEWRRRQLMGLEQQGGP